MNEINSIADDSEIGQPAPESFKNILVAFLKTITGFAGDLSKLTCPAIMLSGVSILEYSAHYMDHPEYFADITKSDDALGPHSFYF